MKTVTIDLPDNVDENEAVMLLAIRLYEEGKISIGQAAKLAGYSKRTFLEVMGKFKGHLFHQSEEELRSDLRNA